jgi:excisionase family DNA binding protein
LPVTAHDAAKPVLGRAGTEKGSARMPAKPIRRWASIKKTALYADLSEKTVRNYIDDGLIPAYKIGGLVKLDLNEVDAALIPKDETA